MKPNPSGWCSVQGPSVAALPMYIHPYAWHSPLFQSWGSPASLVSASLFFLVENPSELSEPGPMVGFTVDIHLPETKLREVVSTVS